jgi:hypothetical protein
MRTSRDSGPAIAKWHFRIRRNWEENRMKSTLPCAISAAVLLAGNMAVFAQATPQAPASPPRPTTQAPQQSGAGQTVTVVGCVQREEDYRKANNLGRGGAAGSGVGAGNEFVLANAMMSSAAGGAAAPGAPTGTGGTNTAYEVTGPNEGQLARHVGNRVEITGMLKPAEAGAAGPTGGPTAGAPPRGVDVTSEDLKLRELEVTSVKTASGTCPK